MFSSWEMAIWAEAPQCNIINSFQYNDCFPWRHRFSQKGRFNVIKAGKEQLRKEKQNYLNRKLQLEKKKILGLYFIIHSKNYNGGLGVGGEKNEEEEGKNSMENQSWSYLRKADTAWDRSGWWELTLGPRRFHWFHWVLHYKVGKF